MASFLTPSHNRWVEFIQSQVYSWVPLSARCRTGCKVPDGMLVLNPYLNCRGLGAIPASACTYLPGLNSFFFLKHLGISLLLLSMAQIFFFFFLRVFTGLELWGSFLPSQRSLAWTLEGVLHPCVRLPPFVGLVPLTPAFLSQTVVPWPFSLPFAESY